MRLGIIVIFITFFLDQISKLWILKQFVYSKGLEINPYAYYYGVIELLPFLNIRLIWNTGISFSLFSSGGVLTIYVILTIQIMIVFLIIFWMKKSNNITQFALFGLIVGGAMGNIYDRFVYGAVVDFIDVFYSNYHFPTFNLADAAISIGCLMWFYDSLFANKNCPDNNERE
tara:strand:+ start:176 stop:691 length:516 start_codon:yes stop_codon:yes gene_type:complete